MNIFNRIIYRIGVDIREFGERRHIYWIVRLGVKLSGGVW